MDQSTSMGSEEQGTRPLLVQPPPQEEQVNSNSDLSMSSESDEDVSQDAPTGLTTAATVPNSTANNANTAMGAVSKKRKPVDSEETGSSQWDSTKKVKLGEEDPTESSRASSLSSDRSLLPAEIWHNIFTFCHPRTLGSLLQTNKLFNSYLDPSSTLQTRPPVPLAKSHVSALQPDAIWQASRRRFWPKMPTPLKEKTELGMWRLACGKNCQFCNDKVQMTSGSAQNKLKPGPGPEGVRTIWPFATRACGPCLLRNSTKELDLLLSSTVPSLILPALSFVLITGEMHVYSLGALQNGQIPGEVQFTKIFLSKQIEVLKEELMSVKAMGEATAEEWLKGLEDRGKESRSDAARWEKWEMTGGVVQMQSPMARVSNHYAMPGNIVANGELTDGVSSVSIQTPVTAVFQPSGSYISTSGTAVPKPVGLPIQPLSLNHTEALSRPQSSFQNGQYSHQPSVRRTREEVNQMKAARRAAIERRAMLLEPPLPPNVLAHIPSFQAALQIPSPLDDAAWELLKPRLLAQRADAEQREQHEQELVAHSRIVHERSEVRRHIEGEGKELTDKDWDDVQAPLRAQLSVLADETIRDAWDNGSRVTKDECPRFAAEVLLYVRRRFYAEIAKDAAARHAAGQEPLRDPPGGPFTQKLTLDNMKWLFETKIKTHTESFRREIFLCHDCEGNSKAYGFEGVVQHYAAKHTTALSQGSVVVHWRSEWPEKPPFHPDPLSANSISSSRAPNGKAYTSTGSAPQYGYKPHPPGPIPSQAPPYINTAPSNYGGPPYGPLQNGAYGQQAAYHSSQPPYGHPYPQPISYAPPYNSYAGPFLPPSYPQGASGTCHPSTGPFGQNYNAFQHNGQPGYQPLPGIQMSDKIRAQLDDLAVNSRQIWMTTAGLKELPGNIRVYVVLHHLARRYRSRFSESPALAMFIDGLSNNKDMRPVRNVNGLMCKACQLGLGNGMNADSDRKAYSLPQLVNHFQRQHVEPLEATRGPQLDWTIDMVYVPDLSSLSNLHSMSGMDDHKYGLITEAFTQAPASVSYQNPGVPELKTAWGTSADPYVSQSHGLPPSSSAMRYGQYQAPPPQPVTIGERTAAEYDPHQPGMHDYQPHATGPAHDHIKAEIIPSSVVYSVPHSTSQSSQHGGSGRASPDALPSGNKGRTRKALSKDRRVMSGPINKSRKGSARPGMERTAREIEEERWAEVEAERQEREIRAIWEEERRGGAKLYSAPTALPPTAKAAEIKSEQMSSDVRHLRQTPMSQQDQKSCAVRESHSSRRPPPPSAASDHEDDLFAGLESHLNQQQVTVDRPSHPTQRTTIKPPAFSPPAQGRCPDSSQELRHSGQRSVYVRERSRSPVYVRYETENHGDRYRDRSPIPYRTSMTYESRRSPVPAYGGRAVSTAYDAPYGRAHRATPPLPYGEAYTGETRSRTGPAPTQFEEAYELIEVRDSRGSYFLKRPLGRHAPEPVYASYGDERPFYRETSAYRGYDRDSYARPGQEGYSRQSAYEQAPGFEQQPVYDTVVARSANMVRQPEYEMSPQPDAASYEEYDPRFPAATPTTAAQRRVRYE